MRSQFERDVPELLSEKWSDAKITDDEIATALVRIFFEVENVEQYRFLKRSIGSFTHKQADPKIELSLIRKFSRSEEFERGLDIIDNFRSNVDRFNYSVGFSSKLNDSVKIADDSRGEFILRSLSNVIEVLRETPSDVPLIDDEKMDDLILAAGRFRRAVIDTNDPSYRVIFY